MKNSLERVRGDARIFTHSLNERVERSRVGSKAYRVDGVKASIEDAGKVRVVLDKRSVQVKSWCDAIFRERVQKPNRLLELLFSAMGCDESGINTAVWSHPKRTHRTQ